MRLTSLRVLAALSSVVALGACGSKSPLYVPDPNEDAGVADSGFDGGFDAGPDGGFDAGPDSGPPPVDECITLPLRDPPSVLEVSFVARILSADVFFLVDVTGSMGEEIAQIQTLLIDDIVPRLATEIPDVRFGVGHFADFPVGGFGHDADEVFRLLQRSTANIDDVLSAVRDLPLQGGLDFPESMVEALYQTATGEGQGRFVPAASCPADTVGYPCFRGGGSPIILTFTDAPSHNGVDFANNYDSSLIRPAPHTFTETVNALRAIGATVLGLFSGTPDGPDRADLAAFARETGAVRGDGTPIVFDIGRDGRFLGDSVVEAVRTLVDEVPIDVDALLEDVPGDEVDTLTFVDQVIALSAAPPSGATIAGDRFLTVHPGTRVTFRILLANEAIPQTDEPQSFLLRVVLRGDGLVRLHETLVQIVVPSRGGETLCTR